MHAEITVTLWKIAASKCHIVRIKCTKFDFRWGSAPDPLGSLSYSTPPNSPAAFKGPNLMGSEGKGRSKERKDERTEEKRGPHIQPPPWASQNLALGFARPKVVAVCEALECCPIYPPGGSALTP